MLKSNFPNPKLNLPKEIRDSKDESTISSFQAINQYIELVGQYIYTRIDLDNDPFGTKHTHAWVLKVVSANILRSLYIRNSVVDAINNRNPINLFISLKAWLEIVGVLASILEILERNLTQEELFKKFTPYTVGSRGKGNFRVGTIDAINVQTMLQKGDKYVAKMIANNSDKPLNVSSKAYITDFYDLASNPSHPSYDAYELVGNLVEEGIWGAKSPDQIKAQIVELLPMYGGLLLSPILIQSICQKIFEIEKEKFSNVKSTKYFD